MSLWALSWRRRRHGKLSTLTETEAEDLSTNPPEVTRSHSSEASTTSHEDFPQEHFRAVRVLQVPQTPEGLRPRPSLGRLRQELRVVEEEESSRPKREFLVEKKTVYPSRLLPSAPSRSWSLPSQPHQPVAGWISPPVSTNGFYLGGQGGGNVATSPRLLPGKARTAVGALVAFRQDPASVASPQHGGYDADADRSHTSIRSLPDHLPEVEWDEIKEEYDEAHESQRYFALDKDPVFLSRTPPRTFPKRNLPLSTFSPNISLNASPSSLAKPYVYHKTSQLPDTSFSSGAALIHHTDNHGYDFAPHDEMNLAEAEEMNVRFASDHHTQVSAMTSSVVENDVFSRPSLEGHLDMNRSADSTTSADWQNLTLDGSLRQQKVRNQRRVREELLLAIVERLQDNVQLVTDVYAADPTVLQTDWFVETPLDQEGLLTGFVAEKRDAVSRYLSAMLDEMNLAQPEDFFLSPSQIPHYTQPHDELQSAIGFCRSLVHMALPGVGGADEDGRWKVLPGLLPAMGILAPESPLDRPRGGDTSVFTLPSESAATPMTSNVSLSTTIATSKGTGRHPQVKVDALQVRQSIEIVSTLVQKLSLCCQALLQTNGLQMETSVRITKDIKRHYQQLMGVDHSMLQSLMDAFELEIAPPPLFKLVSNDEADEVEDVRTSMTRENRAIVFPPPRVIRNSFPKTQTPGARSTGSSTHDLFSPQTLDMLSTEVRQVPTVVPEEYDDLRRQVGSVDYDDVEEMREGPEACERE